MKPSPTSQAKLPPLPTPNPHQHPFVLKALLGIIYRLSSLLPFPAHSVTHQCVFFPHIHLFNTCLLLSNCVPISRCGWEVPGTGQDRVPVLAGCSVWQQSLRPIRNRRCWGRQGPTADSPAPPQPRLLNHKLPRRKETEPLKKKGQEGPACLSHHPPWGSMAPRETSKPCTPHTPGHCLTEAPSLF